MTSKQRILVGLLIFGLAGCSRSTPAANPTVPATPVAAAYQLGSIKKGDKGLCVVCLVKEGMQDEEPVVETLDYKGHTYVFCNEAEKADFISDPRKYAGH